MPILQIRALPQKNPSKIQSALKKTCLAISEAYVCKPEQVWATWEDIKAGYYVEGSREANQQPEETHPPIVQLTCFEGRTPEEIEKVLHVAAKTLSEELGIPQNIFISYHELKSGQVVAGDGIVRKK